MCRTRIFIIAAMALLLSISVSHTGYSQVGGKDLKRNEDFDPIAFIKRFKMGMTYTEVQEAMPGNVEQDILSYIPSDEVFLLSVDLPMRGDWNASFKFDTLDTPMRRPEQLVELACSAGLSSRNDSFDSIVRRVNAVFGEPVKLDRSQEKVQQAGWRMTGGSILTLEYSLVTGIPSGNNVSVDFVIRKKKTHPSANKKAFA